jgi:formylglycine-generating enzyme required for sulfatase activity
MGLRAGEYRRKWLRGTTPVGSYPDGVSPYGVLDLAGNVAEWTSTTLQPYPYRARDGREDQYGPFGKVARGGAWYFISPLARAATRLGFHPALALTDIGVRLARGGGLTS